MFKGIKKAGVTEELIKAISVYLSTRIGIDEAIIFSEGETRNNDRVTLRTNKIDSTRFNTGIFFFTIKEFYVIVDIYTDIEKGIFCCDVSLQYEHRNGGRNGHDTNIRLKGNLNDCSFVEC